jgi:fused signal recognition particle receptor
MVALAKLLALCAGAAGGAACVATGVLPAPDLAPQHTRKPVIEQSSLRRLEAQASEAIQYEPAPEPAPQPEPTPKPEPKEEPESTSPETAAAPTGAIEYEPPPPPPAPEPPSASGSEGSPSGSAAGEFGP